MGVGVSMYAGLQPVKSSYGSSGVAAILDNRPMKPVTLPFGVPMRALLFTVSLFAILAVGCGEPAVTMKDNDTPVETNTTPAEKPGAGIPLDKVDEAGLEAAIAANHLTLIDFTAVW